MGFFAGVAVALAIALPLTITDDEPCEENSGTPTENPPIEDLGAQRFPTHDFVAFDALWESELKYKTFNYKFSKVTPDKFICEKANGEIWKFPINGYQDGKGKGANSSN